MRFPTTAAVAAVGLTGAILLCAQAPASPPNSLKFEVATLKASPAGGRGGGIRPAPGGERYQATNVPLRLLIMVAYRVKADQVTGGPSWMDTDTWDMNAKAERPSNVEELHVMLQNLLSERFHLQFHRETKELPVYALSVDKGGPKMQPHEAQNAGEPWMDQSVEQVVRVKMNARFVPMDYFAWRLGQVLDRPVIDQTRLKGGYDFDLAYTRDLPPGIPEGAMINGAPIDTSGPNIFAALRQQLGLRLDAQKGPVDIMVIDHAEKPAEN
jgi:uncharacterized protein (TIGR03435 family)